MAAQRGVGPQGAGRAGNAVVVEATRDGARADAGAERAEDAADDLRLGFVDLPLAPDRLALAVGALHHVVAVAQAAAGFALLDPTPYAAMGLGGEVLEEQGVHCALEADMKLADLALGQGDDLNAGEAQMFEEGRHVRLVAAHAVQCLGQHHVERAALGVLQDGLHARPQDHAGARYRGIVIGANNLPSFPAGVLTADAELILDGGLPLVVGRIARVERNLGHGVDLLFLVGLRRGPVVVGGAQPLELFACDLPTDEAGDGQHGGVDPGFCRLVVVRCDGAPGGDGAIFVLDHPRPFPKKI